MKTAGVLAVLASCAILACAGPVGAADNVLLSDWAKAIWTAEYDVPHYQVDNAYLSGADNQVKTWIVACPKFLKSGTSVYLPVSCVTIAVIENNGWLVWNSAVDNVVPSTKNYFGYGGRFQLPTGFWQRLPRRK